MTGYEASLCDTIREQNKEIVALKELINELSTSEIGKIRELRYATGKGGRNEEINRWIMILAGTKFDPIQEVVRPIVKSLANLKLPANEPELDRPVAAP